MQERKKTKGNSEKGGVHRYRVVVRCSALLKKCCLKWYNMLAVKILFVQMLKEQDCLNSTKHVLKPIIVFMKRFTVIQ